LLNNAIHNKEGIQAIRFVNGEAGTSMQWETKNTAIEGGR